MTTKQLILAEIERLEEMDYPVDTYEQSVGFYNALDRIKSFLDTLPDEPVTDCHELEEAAIDFADYARKALYSKDYAISSIADYDHGCIDGFKAGAEWGAERLADASKTISEDLEEAAEKRAIEYAEKEKPKDADGEIWRVGDVMIENRMSFEDGFKAGAEWMKTKMMEGAVEGFIFQSADYYPKQLIAGYDGELGMSDKVKVIIVKEDEK